MDGTVRSPMLIVLQEKGGTLGPRVSRDLPNTPNLIVQASKSGNVTKPIIREFALQVVGRNLQPGEECVLLLDQCNVQKDDELFNLQQSRAHNEISRQINAPHSAAGRLRIQAVEAVREEF